MSQWTSGEKKYIAIDKMSRGTLAKEWNYIAKELKLPSCMHYKLWWL